MMALAARIGASVRLALADIGASARLFFGLLARSPGIIGAITGRAIYEGTLDVAEAQSFCDNFKG